jgi:hypothetical protein
MGDVRVISIADAVCGAHAFQRKFQLFGAQKGALCRNFQVSIESPHRYSLLVALIPLSHCQVLNTSKLLVVPTARNPED